MAVGLSAFGGHASRMGDEHDTCCAPDCEAPSAIVSHEVPLCERHVLRAYQHFLEFAGSIQRNPLPNSQSAPGVLGVPLVEQAPHVYYVQFADRVKIGVTSHLSERLEALPHDRLLAVEVGDRELEQKRHRQFASDRITGEWFAMSESLVGHIAEVVANEQELGPGMRRFLRLHRPVLAL